MEEKRGFETKETQRQREIEKQGKAGQEKITQHEFTSEQVHETGQKDTEAEKKLKDIGHKGGESRGNR